MKNSVQINTIRFIVGSLDVGGTETHLSRILPELISNTIQPVVITLTHKGILAAKLEDSGIPVYEPPEFVRITQRIPYLRRVIGPFTTACYLIRMYIKYPASLTCFYLPSSYFLGMIAAILTGETDKTIMFRRSLNVYQDNWPFVRFLEPWLHKLTGSIVGNSQAVIQQLTYDEAVPPHKLTLIYNGIDVDAYTDSSGREAVRRDLGIEQGMLVFSIIANLIPYKGHADLLSALSRIADKILCPWVLLCVGSGLEQRQDLEALVTEYNLTGKVRWLGQRKDVAKILSASDIGFLVSHHEGFSNSLLEGMAAGLPMIVTAVGGNTEAIIDKQCGVVVPPKNPEALAEAILNLANNHDLAIQYGLAARERVRSTFSMMSCLDSYKQLFAKVMAK